MEYKLRDTRIEGLSPSVLTHDVKPIKTLHAVFVLLVCEQNMTASVIEKIKLIPAVSDIKQVDGCYDVIICLEAESDHTIKQIMAEKIRLVDGIRTCVTLPCVV